MLGNSEAEVDPVCGMTVSRASAPRHRYCGVEYRFCCDGCCRKFAADPERYLNGQPAPVAPAGATYGCPMDPEVERDEPGSCPKCGMALEVLGVPVAKTRWICPMDPEVAQDEPGSCPKCGMALEPQSGGVELAPNPELEDMTRRLRWAVLFAVPLVIVAMGDMLPGRPISRALSPRLRMVLEMALATPLCLWIGWPFLERAVQSVRNRSLNMFTLIGLGVAVSYLYSAVAVVAPSLFPQSFREGGHVAVYFEAAGVIVTLILVGQVLELLARSKANASVHKLLALAATSARRVADDGSESDVPLDDVVVGDRLRVRPGDKVPVDAVVVTGSTAIDESMVSGEVMPVEKTPGDTVIGATLNSGTGTLIVRAQYVGANTVLSRIVDLVAQAQRSKAPIQRVADVVAGYFVPAVISAALATFVVWAGWGPEPRMAFAIVNAVAVLIIACPCALGLATPMTIMVATGIGARAGVLFRDAQAIEVMRQVDTLLVDKTGTLTEGRPRVVEVACASGFNEADVVRCAASVERGSGHPLAQAFIRAAAERQLQLPEATGFESHVGKGVTATVDGVAVAVGNDKLMADCGIDIGEVASAAARAHRNGQTAPFVAIDSRMAGVAVVADPVRESSEPALAALRAGGVRIVMLTGDNEVTAKAVADELGITSVVSGVLPEGKLAVIEDMQREGRVVAMAGDGINDAPALARADVGIAMGTGTDIAMETASVTLVGGDLRALVRARRLSVAAIANIRQNLVFAFLYNGLGIPLAAGVLYPTFGVLLSPMIAAGAMSLSSVSVIANALRLRRVLL